MKLAVRILMAVFAVAGAVAWTLLLAGVLWYGHQMVGMGDGASSGATLSLPELLLVVAIWLVPMAAFVFMFLGAINVLKGKLRRVGYWYALVFLMIASAALLVLYPGMRVLKWIGLVCLLMTGLWAYAFREKSVSASIQSPCPPCTGACRHAAC